MESGQKELEYLRKMKQYLKAMESITPEEARNTLISIGVINKRNDSIDHYQYLTVKSKK